VTTGQSDVVVWGGVHQKTSPRGGAHNHGWPDETYFDRLTSEAAAKGVQITKKGQASKKRAAPPAAPAAGSSSSSSSSSSSPTKAAPSGFKVLSASDHQKVCDLDGSIAATSTLLSKAMRQAPVDQSEVRRLMNERKAMQDAKAKILGT